MSLEIIEALIARQTPEAQAIIRLLLAQIAELSARIAELKTRLGKTPQNSSLPPSAQHPHAKPPRRKPKSRSGGAGSRGIRVTNGRSCRPPSATESKNSNRANADAAERSSAATTRGLVASQNTSVVN